MCFCLLTDYLAGSSLFKLLGCWIHNKKNSYVCVLSSREQRGMIWNY